MPDAVSPPPAAIPKPLHRGCGHAHSIDEPCPVPPPPADDQAARAEWPVTHDERLRASVREGNHLWGVVRDLEAELVAARSANDRLAFELKQAYLSIHALVEPGAGGSGAVSTRTPDPRDFDLCRIPEPPADEGSARVSVGPAKAAEPPPDPLLAKLDEHIQSLPPGSEERHAAAWVRTSLAAEAGAPEPAPNVAEIAAEVMGQHSIDPTRTDADRNDYCICGGWISDVMSVGWDDHLAEALAHAGLLAGSVTTTPADPAAPKHLPGIAVDINAGIAPALIGTWADPTFAAHQEHKHAVDGCGYCPSEEDR